MANDLSLSEMLGGPTSPSYSGTGSTRPGGTEAYEKAIKAPMIGPSEGAVVKKPAATKAKARRKNTRRPKGRASKRVKDFVSSKATVAAPPVTQKKQARSFWSY